MALLNADEMKRSADFSKSPDEPGMPEILRRFTPSVCAILSRVNSPFMTGAAGFEAIGISTDDLANCVDPMIANPEYEDGGDKPATLPNPQFKPEKIMLLLPSIAEAMVLITCPLEKLREFHHDQTNQKLRDASFDFMESGNRGPMEIAAMFGFVAERQASIASANFTIPDEEKEGAATNGKKKKMPNRHGSRRM